MRTMSQCLQAFFILFLMKGVTSALIILIDKGLQAKNSREMKNDNYTHEPTVCIDDMLPASSHLSHLIRLFFLESSLGR